MGNQLIEAVSPRRALTLWRERWGKVDRATAGIPYLQGQLTGWGDRLTDHPLWSAPGIYLATSLCCLTLFFLTIGIFLAVPAQIIFSVSLIGFALYLRRYEGLPVTLVLIGLSVMASARYLNWRFSSVLSLEHNLTSILTLGLCLAELYLWTVTTLGFITAIWPLKRLSKKLPADIAEWPTVDVFITIHNCQLKTVKNMTMAALALEWPGNKLKIFLLDNQSRSGIAELARSSGFDYLVLPSSHESKSGNINLAVSQAKGSLIVLLQSVKLLEPQFLKKAVGWFLDDSKLGMIHTPNHFLSPEISEKFLSIFGDYKPGPPAAMIRRIAFTESNGIDLTSATQGVQTTFKLQNQGYRHALIGFSCSCDPGTHDLGKSCQATTSDSVEQFLVDSPFSESILRWKKRLVSFQFFLNFYSALPRFIFYTAPLAYLLGGIDVIQMAPALFLAYFAPAVLHSHFATARFSGKTRLTNWNDLKEMIVAWYLLLPTTLFFLRAIFFIKKEISNPRKNNSVELFFSKRNLFIWVVIIFNMTGFFWWIYQEITNRGSLDLLSSIYLAWTAYNVMLLITTLAVTEECWHLQRYSLLQARQAIMIKMPTGRTITGETENFPDLTLAIKLPVEPALEVGTIIDLSIFRGPIESTFSAKVVMNDHQSFRVMLSEQSQKSYLELGRLALARDEKWQRWLPGRNADRPLPKWLDKHFIAISRKIFNDKKIESV